MKRSIVRASVCPVILLQLRAAGLLCGQEISTDSGGRPAHSSSSAAARRSAANASSVTLTADVGS